MRKSKGPLFSSYILLDAWHLHLSFPRPLCQWWDVSTHASTTVIVSAVRIVTASLIYNVLSLKMKYSSQINLSKKWWAHRTSHSRTKWVQDQTQFKLSTTDSQPDTFQTQHTYDSLSTFLSRAAHLHFVFWSVTLPSIHLVFKVKPCFSPFFMSNGHIGPLKYNLNFSSAPLVGPQVRHSCFLSSLAYCWILASSSSIYSAYSSQGTCSKLGSNYVTPLLKILRKNLTPVPNSWPRQHSPACLHSTSNFSTFSHSNTLKAYQLQGFNRMGTVNLYVYTITSECVTEGQEQVFSFRVHCQNLSQFLICKEAINKVY